ncbi:MAG: hypothetical protein KC502_17980 [Myxococcales bacterium]|nr:hypothetical protein [Myxococcales bacterium]
MWNLTVARPSVLLLALTFIVAGCGDDSGVEGKKVADAGTSESDAKLSEDVGEDTAVAEDTSTADAGSDAGADTGDELVCPGAPGCECTSDDGCYSGHCVENGGAKTCAKNCTDSECSDSQVCVETKGQGSKKDKICVEKFAALCNPCLTNESCAGLGAPGAACVDRGDDGGFCATACSTSTDCSKGYSCEDVTDVDGKSTKQCVLPKGETCACSDVALSKEMKTYCYASHSNGGKCKGTRRCAADGTTGAPDGGGLTACDAPEAATETCDGLDNDCDGETDKDTCDDGNPCTKDACSGAEGCKYTNDSGEPCDADGSVCTEKDVCKDGKCTAGAAKSCDDNNVCTTDSCDPKLGCVNTGASNIPCNSDDNPCTVNDVCKSGKCEAGEKKACDSGDVCIHGKCNLTDGKCKYTNKDGDVCNDGNPCTKGEKCKADTCKGEALDCDDKNTCTVDSCDPSKNGCQHKEASGPCDDGSKCSQQDACKDGKCVGLAINVTTTCDDDNDCTTDACDPDKGCTHDAKNAGGCDDDNACTLNDKCKAGKCESGQNTCGCNSDKDCAGKEDGNLCNGTLYCNTSKQPFQCEVKPGSKVTCDTSLNNSCQTNACNPKNGQCSITQETAGKPCDADGNVCTKDDACKNGKCLQGAPVECNDKNPCTDDSCDPKKGCAHKPNTNPCNADDNLCTVADACQSGTCVPAKAKDCDDKEACTKDSCSATTGKCLHAPIVDKCNDNNACTSDDKCGKEPTTGVYTCFGPTAVVCNDKNPCTQDQCDKDKGCVFNSVTDGQSCDDGNACTDKDACTKGACGGSKFDPTKKCDDNNPCTTESCNPQKGCISTANNAATCDDGNACTKNDFCKDAKCNSGVNTCGCSSDKECAGSEDGNVCNGTLYCDKSAQPFQCKVNPGTIIKCDSSVNSTCQKNNCNTKTGKCEIQKEKDGTPCKADDNVCTAGDACNTGVCKPGALLKCDDNNSCTSDSCDPKSGCVNTPLSGACTDGDACTTGDACQGGVCKGQALNVKEACDDNNQCTIDACDKKTGCTNTALVNKSCDDGNSCTQNDTCVKGSCKGGTNTCACTKNSDCSVKEDGNACNGTLFCDKNNECKVNPVTIVKCDTSKDNYCLKTSCAIKTGKCEQDIKSNGTPCDADGSLCTTKDACNGGKCAAGSILPCDDVNPCTADSCDPKKGCVHTPQGGACNADDNACTAGDKCVLGKCAAGKIKDCNDNNPCTADSCDKSTGKCTWKNLIQSCSDGNACTSGDNCAKDATGKWTCVSGKGVTCNDGNPCTEDKCSIDKGCSNPVNTNLSVACYTGPSKTRKVGECKDGVQKCAADGSLGKCLGDVKPVNESCDGKDNDCSGVTDEGCAPTNFTARTGNAAFKGAAGKTNVRMFVGGSNAGGTAKGTKYTAKIGFYQWLGSLLGLK